MVHQALTLESMFSSCPVDVQMWTYLKLCWSVAVAWELDRKASWCRGKLERNSTTWGDRCKQKQGEEFNFVFFHLQKYKFTNILILNMKTWEADGSKAFCGMPSLKYSQKVRPVWPKLSFCFSGLKKHVFAWMIAHVVFNLR